MLSKKFKVGDLVWAKMKGFPPWPAKIIDPPSGSKSPRRKGQHYVFFFGSNNHAWILDENIVPHSEEMLNQSPTKIKSTQFKTAIECIIKFSKSIKHENKSPETKQDILETDLEKDVAEIMSSGDPVLVAKPESKEKLLKKQQSKKKVMLKTPRKRLFLHTKSFSRRYSSLNKDEGLNNSFSSYPPSKMLKSSSIELASASLENEISSEIESVDEYSSGALKKIGFLGLSPMNKGIVNHLLRSGHSVSIWNESLETCDSIGANASKVIKCATPAEVVINSDIIFCCASDSDAAKIILFDKNGILSALEDCGSGKGYVEMTTFDPRSSSDFSEIIKRTGAEYLEAPFSGSRKDIDSGVITILAAGDHSLFLDCKSCFSAIAKYVYFVSQKVGDATKMNVIINSLSGTVYASLAESMALAQRLKISNHVILNVLQKGTLCCDGITEKAFAIATRNFPPGVPLGHIQQNMSFALSTGSDVASSAPVMAAANEAYKHAKFLRYSESDVAAVYHGIKY